MLRVLAIGLVLISLMTLGGRADAATSPRDTDAETSAAGQEGPRAKRSRALARLAGAAADACDATCRSESVAALIEAAVAGDNLSLIRLEQMRLRGEAGAPSLSDIIDIEIARAERGDAMTAWRLAQRYETGDGVPVSYAEMVRWLTVTAMEDPAVYPYAKDAAYRLCMAYGAGDGVQIDDLEVRKWCGIAAKAGHAAAAIVVASLDGTAE